MAISHLCIRCGWDLARIRPKREPHYGLQVVSCPKCAKVAVRSEHPIWKRWHQFRRIDWTLTALALQTVCFGVLGTLTTMAIPFVIFNAAPWVGSAIINAGPADDYDLRGLLWLCFWVFGVLGPFTGAWLTAGFSHIRLWKVWAGWALIMLALEATLALYFIVAPSNSGAFPMQLQGTSLFQRMWIAGAVLIAPGSIVLAMMMITALLGIPAGRLWLWLGRSFRYARWRWRRKHRRLAKAA